MIPLELLHLPVTASLPLKERVGCVGGCFGSSEDKVAIPHSQGLFILSPNLSLGQHPTSQPACVADVQVKARFTLPVNLPDSLLKEDTDDPDTFHHVFAESSTRAAMFPFEEIQQNFVQPRKGVRTLDWSPRNVDRFGRSVFCAITLDGRAAIFGPKSADTWEELVDLTQVWHTYYVTNGRIAKKPEDVCDERPDFDLNTLPRAAEHPLNCNTILEYLDAVEDMNFVTCSWSALSRRPDATTPNASGLPNVPNRPATTNGTKAVAPIILLATLMKSGALAVWAIHLPLVGVSSVTLLYVDYTYSTSRSNPKGVDGRKATFIKFCDLDATQCMLTTVLSDGCVIGSLYDLHFSSDGSFWMKLSHRVSLIARSISYTPVVACSWSISDGVLCLGYGVHLLVAALKVVVREHTLRRIGGVLVPTYQVLYDRVTKPRHTCGCITGVYYNDKRVYISTIDGYIATARLQNPEHEPPEWEILWSSASCLDPELVMWEFHGLTMSCNGVHLAFVEKPINCLDNMRRIGQAVYLPQVRFLSMWTNAKLLELTFNFKLPLHRKVDALQQLCYRWPEGVTSVRNECIERLELLDAQMGATGLPDSWMGKPLPCLHLYRFILQLLQGDEDTVVQNKASELLPCLDDLIRDLHLDRCFRRFLESSVQRQAVDCILVARMAIVIIDWYKQNSEPAGNPKVAAPENSEPIKRAPRCVLPTLRKTAEQVLNLARQLYIHRFKLPATDLPAGSAPCPVCSETTIPGLNRFECPNGHVFDRCMQTLEPCANIAFRYCDRCDRYALTISPQDRLSVWRMTVLHPVCVYCDFPLNWREF